VAAEGQSQKWALEAGPGRLKYLVISTSYKTRPHATSGHPVASLKGKIKKGRVHNMKAPIQTFVVMAAIAVSTFISNTSEAAVDQNRKATCKVTTHDIGTIIGRGGNPLAAFEDAAEQCFERRAQLHRLKSNSDLDEDTGMVVIDTCANIKCG
jgi:predicted RNA-binding protein YlqC (UPF0109 family)